MPSNRRLPFFWATFLAMTGIAFAGAATLPAVVVRVARGAAAAASGQYLRFVDQGAGGRLETAETVFVNDQGTVVRLVAAVHIGEGSYFKGLADSFHQRDAVLYELVNPKDVDVPRP